VKVAWDVGSVERARGRAFVSSGSVSGRAVLAEWDFAVREARRPDVKRLYAERLEVEGKS
jgi:hypothetical protein